MGMVFINYRSTDNPLAAAGIHDALVRRFGADQVFRDSVSLEAGVHYPTAIREALELADVLVAVIGPQWLTLTDAATGRRLIDREHDWVRKELARAFQRKIHVVPVLLQDTPANATQPNPADLPSEIKPLATIQAFPLSHRRFGTDVDRLATRLAELMTKPKEKIGRTNGTAISPTAFAELVTALEAVPCIFDEDTRAFIVGQLRPAISRAIPDYPQRRAHVVAILSTCLEYDGGLPELVGAITAMEPTASRQLQQLSDTITRAGFQM